MCIWHFCRCVYNTKIKSLISTWYLHSCVYASYIYICCVAVIGDFCWWNAVFSGTAEMKRKMSNSPKLWVHLLKWFLECILCHKTYFVISWNWNVLWATGIEYGFYIGIDLQWNIEKKHIYLKSNVIYIWRKLLQKFHKNEMWFVMEDIFYMCSVWNVWV